MQNKALITGIAGQDGSYLAEWLLQQGYEVHGVTGPIGPLPQTPLAPILDQLHLYDVDLLDEAALSALLEQTQPDEFYNLAARSFVPDSNSDAAAAAEINALAVLHMLEAIRHARPTVRFFQASSSQCFGRTLQAPQNEATPFHPSNPYGAAKAYAHWLTVQYRESYGLFACCGILFNHESPRRAPVFVTRKIAQGAARIKLGLASEVRLGNLQARRDWGFAGDYMQAAWRMLQLEQAQDFVIGTGRVQTVEDFARLAFAHVGLDWRDHVVVDPEYYRPDDPWLSVADARQARQRLDWEPSTTFTELVAMMVDADLEQFRSQTRPAVSTNCHEVS